MNEQLKTYVKWVFAALLANLIVGLLSSTFKIDMSTNIFIVILLPALVGVFQWLLVLRVLSFEKPWLWTLVTTVGYSLGGLIAKSALFSTTLGVSGLLLGGIIWGAVYGFFQWWLMRQKYAKSGFYWLLTNIFGFTIAVILIWPEGHIASNYIMWLSVGVMSGAALVRLEQQRFQKT
jgi:hypothetical protein